MVLWYIQKTADSVSPPADPGWGFQFHRVFHICGRMDSENLFGLTPAMGAGINQDRKPAFS
jgi:hypothetical protein